MKKNFGTLFFLHIHFLLQAQIVFKTDHYDYDPWMKIIVCNEIPDTIPNNTTELVFHKNFRLNTPIHSISKGDKYLANHSGENYTIYFTEAPIIKIEGLNNI